MEANKKGTKYNVEKKITIKYYFYEIKNSNTFSLNILLTVNRKVTKFKSKINYTEPFIVEEAVLLKHGFYSKAIEREKALIMYIVNELKPFENDSFDIKEVYGNYSNSRWNLLKAVNDLMYFELFSEVDNLLPIHFVSPFSFLQFTKDSEVHERASVYKSKIWFMDMLIWALSQNNDNGFLAYSPTVHDLITGLFQQAINSDNFLIINKEEKQLLTKEIEILLSKYNDVLLM